MNTKNLKAYAPKARSQFIEAIKKRAAQLGIYQDKIADVQFEGGAAIIEGRAFTKKQGEQRKALERKIEEKSLATHKERYDLFIREMAYTWFNRLAAIRYMELHDYLDHGFRVLSNPNGAESLPEILDHASDVVDTLDPDQKYLDKNHIIELQLAGNKEEELYRELLLGQCHRLYKIMPFMFEQLDDATELLLPDNLTKTDSILKGLICDIPEEDWSEIEVIGWLYQFYISEHKDAVIGKVVKSEDIPAATQLFTPNWIVKYLVQNSLGRQWLATYPGSELKGKMEYYIEPAEQSDDVIGQLKAITPASINPEEIKIIDPAVGSGHILVEVYEVLREIYLERGYRLREIPELILTKNIYGLDIDDRAAQLAGFALMMKAREDDRRIFQRVQDGEVTLNIYSLQSTESLDIPSLWRALDLEGNQQQGSTGGLFDMTEGSKEPSGIYKEYYKLLQTLQSAFLQAKTLGSLIQIENEHLTNLVALKELFQTKEQGSDPAAKRAAIELLPIINQAIILAQRYISTIMNPPYLGSKGMNAELKEFAKKQFPNSKSDLFALFMERAFGLLSENGYNAQVNMQSWMFLSSYESLREWLLDTKTFVTMAHLGARAFGQISGEVVQTTAWVINNLQRKTFIPSIIRLTEGGEQEKIKCLLNRTTVYEKMSQSDFFKIPGYPIIYWTPDEVRNAFVEFDKIGDIAFSDGKNITGDNNRYQRFFWEVPLTNVGVENKWVFISKGGGLRKWIEPLDITIDWSDISRANYKKSSVGRLISEYLWFKEGITWGLICTSYPSFRKLNNNGTYSDLGMFIKDNAKVQPDSLLNFLNSTTAQYLLKLLNPTLNYPMEVILRLPYPKLLESSPNLIEKLQDHELITLGFKESAFQFKSNPIIKHSESENLISKATKLYLSRNREFIYKIQSLEEHNNRFFSEHLKLDKVISNNVSIKEVTIDSNPEYRFPNLSPEEAQKAFCSELISDFLNYSLSCMMGRYSLNREGLVYANSGNEGFKELVVEGAYETFPADDDGIVPLASEDWLFDDDATTRFKEFIKTVWGKEHLDENLEFVAESLCLHALKPLSTKKGMAESAMDTVRRYFSTQFFKDHCKTYKKRPIYWLFSSGKEKAFECLVYLHRYNEGTLSRMRTEYVTPLMGKYEHMLNHLTDKLVDATSSEKRDIEKEQKSLTKKQAELRTFDEQLKHYAEMRITIDLDDGVKANYGKFGNLLADVKSIHGKAVK